MTITVDHLLTAGTDLDADSYTTADPGFTRGAMGILVFWPYDAGAGVFQAHTVTGYGKTWDQVGSIQGYGNQALCVYVTEIEGGTPSGLQIDDVVSTGTADGAIWLIAQALNVDFTDQGAVGDTPPGVMQAQTFGGDSNRSGGSTVPSPNLGTLRDAQSMVLQAIGIYDNAGGALDITQASGWTLIGEASQTAGGDTLRVGLHYKENDATTPEVAVSAGNDRGATCAWEIAHWRPRPSGLLAPAGIVAPHGGFAKTHAIHRASRW
jgi:hypothetical protein